MNYPKKKPKKKSKRKPIKIGHRERIINSSFKKYGKKCRYCGIELEKHQIQIDHIIPVCKGGTNEFKNLAVCCKFCNVMKFGFSLKDYLQHLAHIRSKYFNCSILDSYSGELTGLEFDRINSTLFELDTENL